MKHFIELTPQQFEELATPFLTISKSTYAEGDELIVSVKDHRDQAVLGISKVIREKVNGKWCYLCLTGFEPAPPSGIKNLSQQDNSQ